MPIEFAELIERDLANEAGAAAESRDPRSGVACRSAAHLMGRPHVRVKPLGLVSIDQPHRAFDQPFRREEVVAGIGDHVDDGIADAQDIEARIGHSSLRERHGKRGA